MNMNEIALTLSSIAACALVSGVLAGIVLLGIEDIGLRRGLNDSILRYWFSRIDSGALNTLMSPALLPRSLPYREFLGLLAAMVNTTEARAQRDSNLVMALSQCGRLLAGAREGAPPLRQFQDSADNAPSDDDSPDSAPSDEDLDRDLIYAERAVDNLQATFATRWRAYRIVFGSLIAMILLAAVIVAELTPAEQTAGMPLFVTSLVITAVVASVLAPLVRDTLERLARSQGS